MSKKLMTSVKLAVETEKLMLSSVVNNGYKLRGKSRWIIEAIESFLALPNYPEFVDIAQDMVHFNTTVSLRLPEELMVRLEKAIITVRKECPEMEGVKSNIIRASIMQKLLREDVGYKN